MAKILLIEDDKDLAESIALVLKSQNHAVELAYDGEDGLLRLESYSYDLIICDWSLPVLTGIDVCQKYRAKGGESVILMLTGRSAVGDVVIGLEAGADDYLAKPFHMRELLARLGALLRRSTPAVQSQKHTHAYIEYDPDSLVVTKHGSPLKLSKKELQLLALFMKNPDKVFSLNALLTSVWQDESEVSEDTVRTHIKTLRSKLHDKDDKEIITNVHGQGYRLSPPEEKTY